MKPEKNMVDTNRCTLEIYHDDNMHMDGVIYLCAPSGTIAFHPSEMSTEDRRKLVNELMREGTIPEERPTDESIPTITPEMIADTAREIAKRREGRQGSAIKDIKNMRCRVCGENAVSFVDDLMIRVGDTDVPNLTGLRCAVCGDYSFDADASKIIDGVKALMSDDSRR